MGSHEIRVRDMTLTSYLTFRNARITNDRSSVRFTYSNGAEYLVPAGYIHAQYGAVEYRFLSGAWKSLDSEVTDRQPTLQRANRLRLQVVKIRRLHSQVCSDSEYHFIVVYLSNGCGHTVHPDHVLISCDPNYEHFGGFDDECRAYYKKLFAIYGKLVKRTVVLNKKTNPFFGVFKSISFQKPRSIKCLMQSGDRYAFDLRVLMKRLGNPFPTGTIERIRLTDGRSRVTVFTSNKVNCHFNGLDVVRLCDDRVIS